jgi:hypothetical protein
MGRAKTKSASFLALDTITSFHFVDPRRAHAQMQMILEWLLGSRLNGLEVRNPAVCAVQVVALALTWQGGPCGMGARSGADWQLTKRPCGTRRMWPIARRMEVPSAPPKTFRQWYLDNRMR